MRYVEDYHCFVYHLVSLLPDCCCHWLASIKDTCRPKSKSRTYLWQQQSTAGGLLLSINEVDNPWLIPPWWGMVSRPWWGSRVGDGHSGTYKQEAAPLHHSIIMCSMNCMKCGRKEPLTPSPLWKSPPRPSHPTLRTSAFTPHSWAPAQRPPSLPWLTLGANPALLACHCCLS